MNIVGANTNSMNSWSFIQFMRHKAEDDCGVDLTDWSGRLVRTKNETMPNNLIQLAFNLPLLIMIWLDNKKKEEKSYKGLKVLIFSSILQALHS